MGKQIAKVFTAILEQERKVEAKREKLCEINDFEPFSKYHSILRYGTNFKSKGVVDGNCLKRFLDLNNLSKVSSEYLALEQDRQSFFQTQFKSTDPRKITYIEFLKFILPTHRKQLRLKIQQKQKDKVKKIPKSA